MIKELPNCHNNWPGNDFIMAKLIIFFIFFISCSFLRTPETEMKKSIVRKISFWHQFASLPLEKKLLPAMPELIDYITMDNEKEGFPARPVAVSPDRQFMADFVEAINELPDTVRLKMKSKVLAILFVEKLGGSGYTDVVLDEKGQEVSSFIVFDYGILKNVTANSWASWKENSAFSMENNFARLKIAEKKDDNRKNALKFILLHELGHAFSVGEKIHPSWINSPKKDDAPYSFFDLSWFFNQNKKEYQLKNAELLPLLHKIKFYTHSLNDNLKDRIELYEKLSKSDFPSLYGASGYADDFAEAFAIYVFNKILKMPYEVTLISEGRTAKVFKSCFEDKRCPLKEKFIQEYLR